MADKGVTPAQMTEAEKKQSQETLLEAIAVVLAQMKADEEYWLRQGGFAMVAGCRHVHDFLMDKGKAIYRDLHGSSGIQVVNRFGA